MHVLVAPNAFKGSLSASVAAEAIVRGLRRAAPRFKCILFPVGDGGDGTGALLIERLGARVVTTKVKDALGRVVTASFGVMERESAAIIELAEASGLRRLRPDEWNPLRATTFGTGELMRAALDEGIQRMVLAVGGSATVDGGTGILQALGARFLNAAGQELRNLPENLGELASIDLSRMDDRIGKCELTVLCDVDNPLLGERGAARVFGPQKGAKPVVVEKLEAALSQLSKVVHQQTGIDVAAIPGGGAAGGVAAGLHGILRAQLVKGIDYFLDVTVFDQALANCDVVITGEGRLDGQTLQGKAPMGVAVRAKRRDIPVIALAGSVDPTAELKLRRFFDELQVVTPSGQDLAKALREAEPNLERAARELGAKIARKP